MKKGIYVLLLGLLFSASAAAQPGPPRDADGWGPPSPEERVERMSEDLGLDEDQQARLLEIFSAADKEREAMRVQHEEQIRQDACALFNSIAEQIRDVLTDQQSAEFDEMMKRKKARLEGHHRRHGRGHIGSMGCGDGQA